MADHPKGSKKHRLQKKSTRRDGTADGLLSVDTEQPRSVKHRRKSKKSSANRDLGISTDQSKDSNSGVRHPDTETSTNSFDRLLARYADNDEEDDSFYPQTEKLFLSKYHRLPSREVLGKRATFGVNQLIDTTVPVEKLSKDTRRHRCKRKNLQFPPIEGPQSQTPTKRQVKSVMGIKLPPL
ncbi:hypothetical protein ScPMuIL_005124 [Solemya velum]